MDELIIFIIPPKKNFPYGTNMVCMVKILYFIIYYYYYIKYEIIINDQTMKYNFSWSHVLNFLYIYIYIYRIKRFKIVKT